MANENELVAGIRAGCTGTLRRGTSESSDRKSYKVIGLAASILARSYLLFLLLGVARDFEIKLLDYVLDREAGDDKVAKAVTTY